MEAMACALLVLLAAAQAMPSACTLHEEARAPAHLHERPAGPALPAAGAAGGAVGAHLPATAANVSNMKLSDKTFAYSITKGAILDVSLTGKCRSRHHAPLAACCPCGA